MITPTFSRLSEGASGLLADVEDGRLRALRADPTDPISEGLLSDVDRASVAALTDPRRITTPMERKDGRLVPTTWDAALTGIAAELRRLRSAHGAGALGLYLGQGLQRSSEDWIRALAVGVALGTPHVFSELSLGMGPKLRMAELMLGHPVPLVSDLGRAHFVVVFGGDQPDTDWGPGTLGMAHGKWIAFSRKTKGTKVVVVGPRRTDFAADMNQHLAIRPGTEAFFLLGMLSAVVGGDWHDRQFVDDYSTGWDALVSQLRPWTVDRCAAICGVDAAALSGVALKFSRAAMAVAHPDASVFAGPHGGLAAWAWLALHTVTANTLRPGALYDHVAPVDLHLALAALPSDGAPRTRATDFPLLLLQAPADCLADEVLAPGEGRLRALLCVQGDPAGRLAGGPRVRQALADLDLLVCLAHTEDATTALARWVLPLTHPWEQADLELLDGAISPRQLLRATPALVPPAGDCRRVSDILAALAKAARPGLRGSAYGPHLAVVGRSLATADLDLWMKRLVDFALDEGVESLDAPPFRQDKGEADRATWRLGHEDGRIRLLPDAAASLLQGLSPPVVDPDRPLWLRTSARVDAAPDALHRSPSVDPGLRMHPDTAAALSLVEGASVRVTTAHGQAQATLHLDDRIRPDCVDLPVGFSADATALTSASHRDPITGVATRDGLACRVEPV